MRESESAVDDTLEVDANAMIRHLNHQGRSRYVESVISIELNSTSSRQCVALNAVIDATRSEYLGHQPRTR